ncbi:unnamed protein product [marine sediment metagenome]|uniref:Uncharacterized protein n=1 Tax=marine sediment metagenome TaxID=412755 RepID=X1IRH1_9ZZZZ
MNKPWWKSRTKVGGVLVGGGMILTSGGKFLLDEIDIVVACVGIVTGIGIILTAIGLRDAIEKKQ